MKQCITTSKSNLADHSRTSCNIWFMTLKNTRLQNIDRWRPPLRCCFITKTRKLHWKNLWSLVYLENCGVSLIWKTFGVLLILKNWGVFFIWEKQWSKCLFVKTVWVLFIWRKQLWSIVYLKKKLWSIVYLELQYREFQG